MAEKNILYSATTTQFIQQIAIPDKGHLKRYKNSSQMISFIKGKIAIQTNVVLKN